MSTQILFTRRCKVFLVSLQIKHCNVCPVILLQTQSSEPKNAEQNHRFLVLLGVGGFPLIAKLLNRTAKIAAKKVFSALQLRTKEGSESICYSSDQLDRLQTAFQLESSAFTKFNFNELHLVQT